MPYKARFRIRRKYLTWHNLLPGARNLLTLALFTASIFGAAHWYKTAVASEIGIGGAAETSPTPSVSTSPSPSAQPGGGIITSPSPSVSPGLETSPSPTPSISPSPTPDVSAATLQNNRAPLADGGSDQIVRPGALVVLDGTGSFDPDTGETSALGYSWKQISGELVEILSARTVTPSFTAGSAGESYIFSLTVRDTKGASAIDTITVATKALPTVQAVPATISTPEETTPQVQQFEESFLVRALLSPADYILLVLSVIATGLLLVERALRTVGDRSTKGGVVIEGGESLQGKVIHHKTGDPIAGALVHIYGEDGKLRSREKTNQHGVFPTFFPVGLYSLSVQAPGFAFAPAASSALAPTEAIVYSGGNLTVKNANRPLAIVIPMKPTAPEVGSAKVRLLQSWQTTQHLGRILSWPIFLAGAVLNTFLVFLAPGLAFLAIEGIYVALVIMKIALEVKVSPAYGSVRDVITHIPLDLAVVRLFDQQTNRLIMTRVTNTQGKFFALPPPNTYRVTVAKPGYATFSKDDVVIKSEHDTTLQMTADLMPLAPATAGSLATARASTL